MFPQIQSLLKYNQRSPSSCTLTKILNSHHISSLQHRNKKHSDPIAALRNNGRDKSRDKSLFLETECSAECENKENAEGAKMRKKRRRSSSKIFSPQGIFLEFVDKTLEETGDHFSLRGKQITTKFRPPHRYKTCMLIFQNCLILYGGLGCEKSLSWAKLSYETLSWQLHTEKDSNSSIFSYRPQVPIFGHSMVRHKEKCIVFGGVCIDDINELTLINSETMQTTTGARAPYRRKDHAAVIYGDLMIVHGGTENRKVKSEIFVYNVPQDRWVNASSVSSPFLCCHKMVSAQIKNKGTALREIFMFGGLNRKGEPTNTLYKLKVSTQNEIRFEEVKCEKPPLGRHSFCLEPLGNNNILLFGGKNQSESTSLENNLLKGVFNDIHICNVNSRIWRKIELEMKMEHRFGMGSASYNGCIFIFGGSSADSYMDATVNVLWRGNDWSEPWDYLKNKSEKEICSTKKMSNKMIY